MRSSTLLQGVLFVQLVLMFVFVYNAFPAMHIAAFVCVALFFGTMMMVAIVPQLAFMWLQPIVTYNDIASNERSRRWFFTMALFVIPIITVSIYLFTFRKYDGIYHLPVFAQLGIARGVVASFIDVYKFFGRILLRIARRVAITPPRPRPRPR